MQYAPTIFTTILSFLRGTANFFICVDNHALCLRLAPTNLIIFRFYNRFGGFSAIPFSSIFYKDLF